MSKRRKKGKPSGFQSNTNNHPEVTAQEAREALFYQAAEQHCTVQNAEAYIAAIERMVKHPEEILTKWIPRLRALDLQWRLQHGEPLFPGLDFNDADAVAAVFTPLVKTFAGFKQTGKAVRKPH